MSANNKNSVDNKSLAVDNEEDVMLKKNKKSFGKIIKTTFFIIVLVLIADFAILLMLNKIGQVDINEHIENVPLINFFTNTEDTIDKDKVLIEELTAEKNDLLQQVKLKETDITKLSADNDALNKEIQLLKEQVSKLQEEDEEEYKLADYYTSMKPKAAANALNEVEPTLAIKIFTKMKDSDVGTIMQYMLPEKVAEISKTYEKQKTKE